MAKVEDTWPRLLSPLADRPLAILEIGSLTGGSAARFLDLLPKARIVCIDPFTGDEFGDAGYNGDVATLEARFDATMARFGTRVRKIRSRSVPALDALTEEGAAFDLIYVDGSHRMDDVMMDSILSWRLLKVGGMLIWDDYLGGQDWTTERPPKDAVDAFLTLHPDYRLLHSGYQLFVEKSPMRPRAPGALAGLRAWTRPLRRRLAGRS